MTDFLIKKYLINRESSLQPIGLDYKTKLIIMGCVSSKAEHDAVAGFATNANLFQVMFSLIKFYSYVNYPP